MEIALRASSLPLSLCAPLLIRTINIRISRARRGFCAAAARFSRFPRLISSAVYLSSVIFFGLCCREVRRGGFLILELRTIFAMVFHLTFHIIVITYDVA